MKKHLHHLLLMLLPFTASCATDRIKDRPLSFSKWRADETLRYINTRYDRNIDSLAMLPVMVVIHFTAMDSLEVSFNYMNKEVMESGRSLLKNAGKANIAVQFLVDKNGEIYRLMPENHIGRHVIGMNRQAIGIENVGANEASLTQAQIEANAYIVRHLKTKYPIRYLIAHSEYRLYEGTPLWEEQDIHYRTKKVDPGKTFMEPLRTMLADLNLKSAYDGGEIPDRLDFVLRAYYDKKQFNGNVLVIKDGKSIFRKSYGKVGSDNSVELTGSEQLYLASAAKPITATAVALLVEQKKLSYETPVTKYFPQLQHLLRGVTIAHLLSHTSGIDDYYRNGKPGKGFSNADAIAIIARQKKPQSAPGKEFHYSNANYVLLAEIIATASGQPFDDFLRERIFTKVPMPNTTFSHAVANPLSLTPAITVGGQPFIYDYTTVGPGGLYTTVDDIASFDTALWENQLLSAAAFQRIVSRRVHVPSRSIDYAFGWYVDQHRGVVYHDGNFFGYHTMNWMYASERTAIILLANHDTDKIREITYEIDRVLHGLSAIRY